MASRRTRDLSRPKLNARSKWGRKNRKSNCGHDVIGGRKSADRKRKKKKKEEKANNKTIFRESPPDTRCLLPLFPGNEKGRKKEMGEIYSGEKEQVGQRPIRIRKRDVNFFCGRICGEYKGNCAWQAFPFKSMRNMRDHK